MSSTACSSLMPSGILSTDASAAGTATASAWPPGRSGRGAEDLGAGVEAHDRVAGPARRRSPAADHARHEHPVAPAARCDVGADVLDRADELVAQVRPGDRHRPVVEVQVGAADRGAVDPQQQPVGAGHAGIGHVLDDDVPLPSQHHGSHGGDPSGAWSPVGRRLQLEQLGVEAVARPSARRGCRARRSRGRRRRG